MLEVVVLGAGTFAQVVREWCRECGIQVGGFVVDVGPRIEMLLGLSVWREGDAIPRLCANGIFDTRRKGLVEKLADREFIKVLHPDASLSQVAGIETGAVVGPGAVIESWAHVGRHVVVNRGCLVGHHVKVGEFTSLGPGANLAGNVKVGRGVFVGMGVCVLPGLEIGDRAVIGAGAVVTRDVRPGVTVVGVPAREI